MAFLVVSLAAFAVVLIFFMTQRRRGDAAWQRYRERHRKRQERVTKDEPIDPNFQFDRQE